jgi:tetratricopeptide (TPR) repeat protein
MAAEREQNVERLLSKANALRAAGDGEGGAAACEEALKLDPNHAGALELLGDILLARGKAKEALVPFRRARELQPARGVLEEKIGLAVLQADETLRALQERELLLSNPELMDKPERNPALSFLLSALLPGAGQMYNTEYAKGGVLLGISLLTFGVMFYSFTALLGELSRVPLGGGMVSAAVRLVHDWSTGRLLWALFNSLLLAGTWGYAVVEAPIRAARLNAEREKRLGLA